jgi:hypothetical protein
MSPGTHTISITATSASDATSTATATFELLPAATTTLTLSPSCVSSDALASTGIQLSVAGFLPNDTVNAYLMTTSATSEGTPVDGSTSSPVTLNADGSGQFDYTLGSVPNGVYSVFVVSNDSVGGRDIDARLTVGDCTAAPAAVTTATGGSTGDTLAASGSDPVPSALGAVALVAAGLVIALVARRRRAGTRRA